MVSIYHTTHARAVAEIQKQGFSYVRAPIMGESVYRHSDGRRAWIDEATSRSYDRHGKHWFMIQVRAS